MLSLATTTILLAFLLDITVGEPPERVHPVAVFGNLVAVLDRDWSTPSVMSVSIALFLPVLAALPLAALTIALTAAHPVYGVLFASLVLFSTTSFRRLLTTARSILDLSATSPARARNSIRALVGRNPEALSPGELRSAALESVAENLSDGLVAPLLAFTLGATVSLPLAVGAATWVKAINTLDSMIGYTDNPLGWASARLDDLVMWFPARLTAGLIAIAAGDPSALGRAARLATVPESPNSGWPMATLATVLYTRFTKPGEYILNNPHPLPTPRIADRGLRIARTAGILAFITAGGLAWF